MSGQVKQIHNTSNSVDSSRYPFWGIKVQKEVKYLQQACLNKINNVKIDQNIFRELLKVAIDSFESEPSFDVFQALSNSHNIDLNALLCVYSGLLKLLKYALKQTSIKQEIIKEDLRDQLKLPADYANDFASIIYGQRREHIERCLVAQRPRYPTLKELQWRVDVSISTSSLNRILEPTILLKLHLSNNQKISFEMNIKKFHLLRFNVAAILKEIDDLENRQIFKLYE